MKKIETEKNNGLQIMHKVFIGILALGLTGCISLLFSNVRDLVIVIIGKIMGSQLNTDGVDLLLIKVSVNGIICCLLIAISITAIIFRKQIPTFLVMMPNKRLYGITIKDIFKEQPFLLILFIFTLYLIKNIFLAIHITGFDAYILVLTLFVHIIASCLIFHHKNKTLICLLACYSMLFLSLTLSSMIYDYSWDGMSYHQSTVIKISEGWNLFYESLPEEGILFWNNHYPKFFEIFASIFLSAFVNIELGKSYNIVFIVIVFVYAYKYTSKFQKNKLMALSISIVFAANPIVLTQFFTYYIDGALGMMIVILIFACMDYELSRDYKDLLIIISVSVFSINTKFTGFVCGFILIGYIFKQIAAGKYRQMADLIIAGFSILIIGIAFTGYNPYITNTINFGYPFYPLYGEEAIDIITPQMIDRMTFKGFSSMHPVQTFFSLFFLEFSLKTLPFNPLKLLKLIVSPYTELRIGGYGILFAEFSIILLLILFFTLKKKCKENYRMLFFQMCILLFISIITPGNWWARFIPYFWYLFGFLMMASDYSEKINKNLFYVCMIIVVINCGYFSFYNTIHGINYTINFKHFIKEIRESRKDIIHIVLNDEYFRYSTAEKIKFSKIDKDIVLILDEDLELSNGFGHNIKGWY